MKHLDFCLDKKIKSNFLCALKFLKMKYFYLSLIALLISSSLFAQELSDSAKFALAQKGELDEAYWKKGASGSLLINQVALSNWQSGGESSLSGLLALNFYANCYFKEWRWDNRLDIRFGQQWIGDRTVKTDDLFDLNSRLDRKLNKNWSASAMLAFRTQFADGFENQDAVVAISKLLAPAYTTFGLGFTYSPSEKFNVFLSPLTMKHTLVNDQRLADLGAFGVEAAELDSLGNVVTPGKKSRAEIGGYLNAIYKTPVMKNIDFQSKLDLFSNYLNNPQNIDVNWENTLNMKVNTYITVQISAHLIYDDDIVFTDANGTGPRTQFKQALGVGLSYKL